MKEKAGREGTSGEMENAAREVVDAALQVHKALGPGLLESVYERCLTVELMRRGLSCRTQAAVPIRYGDTTIDAGLRLDLIVSELVVVELKSVDRLRPVHLAQLLTYLKLSGFRLGFLINFNVPLLRQGLRRVIL
jgi:GxxExxY protein